MKTIGYLLLTVVLLVSGCGYGYYEPSVSEAWQITPYNTVEDRIETLERNAREARIGAMFPDIASRPSF